MPALWDDGSGSGFAGYWTVADGRSGFSDVSSSFAADFIEPYGLFPTSSVSEADTRRFARLEGEWTGRDAIMTVPGLVARELRGWPFRCLAADHIIPGLVRGNPGLGAPGGVIPSTAYTVVGGLKLGEGARGVWGFNYGRVLPLTPRWGGLLLDVALFGTVSAALSTAFVTLRRRRRRLRGLCTACGYPHPPSPEAPCPECGAPTPTPTPLKA